MRSLYVVSCRLALALSLVAVVGVIFLSDGVSHVRAEQLGQNGVERLGPAVTSFPRLAAFDHARAKSAGSEVHLWRETKQAANKKSGSEIRAGAEFHRALRLNETAQRKLLSQAPMEFTEAAERSPVVMTLPLPNGTFGRFRVEESPMLASRLAARFPEIRTYRGRGLDDPTATTRFDVTPAGFHAIVLSARGTFIIEPAPQGRRGDYVSYDRRQSQKDAGAFSCVVYGAEQSSAQPKGKQLARSSQTNPSTPAATTLRTYRLAIAATAEFTSIFGSGTVDGALSVITTNINAVNAIYERDLAIHLTLIDNEASIIFTNSATDGYTSDNANTMLEQNQVVLDQRIGPANYDVGMVLDGHVYNGFRFLFQGAAQYQSACGSTNKGKAATILRSTEPSTISAIYVVAHELAHKFGALHTFNGSTQDCGPSRFAENAYEPGNGSSIMGYRGGVDPEGNYLPICTTEDLRSTDTYFHTASIEQIVNFTTSGGGSSCPATTVTGNNPPNVDAGADYTIPANTPFALTATAGDPESDALTYCWEEFDLGAAGPPHTDNGDRPIFRSFPPSASPARTFPQLSDILSGAATFGESLPTTTRTMNFRVTVRDNHPGAGGVSAGAMRVNVVTDNQAFAVTQPAAATTWPAGSNQTITWNVAGTALAPINCANVRLLLSIDGGHSFPFTLAASRPNNGVATISVPNTPTSHARVKVEAIDNIFFNISLPSFTITPNNTAPPTLLTQENTNRALALDSVTFVRDPFNLTAANNFSLDLDQRTRIILFAMGLELMPGENLSVVTAQAEDAAHRIFPLAVEYVGKVPNFDWLTQVVVRLPDGLAGSGDVLVSVSLRGAASNKVAVGIR